MSQHYPDDLNADLVVPFLESKLDQFERLADSLEHWSGNNSPTAANIRTILEGRDPDGQELLELL